MKAASLLLCLSAACAPPLFACLWLEGTSIDGRFGPVARADASPDLLGRFIPMIARDQRHLFEATSTAPSDPVSKTNDKAVRELLRGNTAAAVSMLEEIAAKHPESYFTAANLGTAYELAGDNQQALQWILKGLELNPDSHMKTEWIHARILETKIQLQRDPSWLATHTISGADFTRVREDGYRLKTRQGEVTGSNIWNALYRHLSVRMLLVKPADPIIAQLLKELAMVEAHLGALEYADGYAKMAVQYGMPPEEMRETVMQWRQIVKDARK